MAKPSVCARCGKEVEWIDEPSHPARAGPQTQILPQVPPMARQEQFNRAAARYKQWDRLGLAEPDSPRQPIQYDPLLRLGRDYVRRETGGAWSVSAGRGDKQHILNTSC